MKALTKPALTMLGVVTMACSFTGCGQRATTEEESLTQQEKRVAQLEERLSRLDRQLAQARSGRGAYQDGPTLSIDRRARTTILDNLHELELELKEAHVLLEQRINHIRNKNQELEEVKQKTRAQQDEITKLKFFERSTKIAQDTLKHTEEAMRTLEQELQSSEHRRLEIEKVFAEFAAEFLKLRALDTKQFDSLQKRLRDRIKRFFPSTTEDGKDLHARNP